MRKVLILGNSASGKSTLAKQLAKSEKLAHLDLDLLAWQATNPPTRVLLVESAKAIEHFIQQHNSWVIEGCYSDLLKIAEEESTEIIFMNLPIDGCIENAKNRLWEPHKYASKTDQDANFSKAAHLAFYQNYTGAKKMLTTNF